MNGLLVIDKPGGVTSRDVVNRAQKWFPKGTKLGHTGTLDPLATGVLVLCVGAATRLAEFVQAMGKTYASRFQLGATSPTDDADGPVTETPGAVPSTEAAVQEALAGFVGAIEQVPPAFSALKVGGRRAHELARGGGEVALAARTVRVDSVRVVHYEWPFLDVEIDCGKGTYIRSVARDLGARLGVGGLVQTLRRTRVGPFAAEQGVGMDATAHQARAKMLPMAVAVAHLPQIRLDTDRTIWFQRGQSFDASDVLPAALAHTRFAVLNPIGELVGIAVRHTMNAIRPEIVFRA